MPSLPSDDLAFLPATEQARLVREREVTAVELVEAYLERIERLDPELNAYVTVCAEEALAAAREPPAGPFSGVPLPIKDLTETAGIRTTFSHRGLADHVPEQDAEIVRRLRRAGFVILGKTNTPEFGTTGFTESMLNGVCRNPWDPSRTPGGSSGGAAAAVAAGLAPIGHGSDGAGSIRIPASCCGLFGIKPTRGRISPAPKADLFGFSTNAPVTHTVADAAAFLDAVSGPEPGDQYIAPPPARPFAAEVGEPPGRLRIGLALEPPLPVPVDPACAAAAEDAGALLAELGHEVEQVTPPWRSDDLGAIHLVVWQTVPTIYPADPDLLEPMNAAFAARSAETSSVAYLGAVARLQLFGRTFASFCAGYDLVLTPTLALPPVPVGWALEPADPWEQFERLLEFTPFTPAVNVAGLPAASVPLSWTDGGLPIGVQLIAASGGEPLLLRVAAQLEEVRPWAGRKPPLS
jgi:amidase